jgi:biotin carboxylase
MDRGSQHLLVFYGLGAAGPKQIVDACRGEVSVVFVADAEDRHTIAVLPILRALGPVVLLDLDRSRTLAQMRTFGPVGAVTFSESMLVATSVYAAELNLPYHSAGTARLLTDKIKQRRALNAAGLSAVSGISADRLGLRDALSQIVPPFVVKPADGSASRYTVGCDDVSEIDTVFAQLENAPVDRWAIESRMPTGRHPANDFLADYVSVETAVSGGSKWHFAVTDKLSLAPPFRETGAVVPSTLGDDVTSRLCDLAGRAIDCLGVTTGLIHTEIKLSPEGPQIIEVNGRLGGAVADLVTHSAGFDPVGLALDIALGRPVEQRVLTFDRIAVQIFVLAPCGTYEVRNDLHKESFAEAVPGVWRVDISHRTGAVVDSNLGTTDAIVAIYVDAAAHAELKGLISAVGKITERFIRFYPIGES